VAVMVFDVSESRLPMMYIEGLIEPLRGLVKSFKPATLHRMPLSAHRDLVGATYKNKITPRPPIITKGHDTRQIVKGKGKMDEVIRRELRRKQLCFTCKEPWHSGHRCLGKGKIHYIEVVYDSE
jgi:hypothetical protein